MSSVSDSLRRVLDTLRKLEDHDEVRSVTRDERGEVRVDLRARTLADQPFVEHHEELTEASEAEPHLPGPGGEDAPAGPGANRGRTDEEEYS